MYFSVILICLMSFLTVPFLAHAEDKTVLGETPQERYDEEAIAQSILRGEHYRPKAATMPVTKEEKVVKPVIEEVKAVRIEHKPLFPQQDLSKEVVYHEPKSSELPVISTEVGLETSYINYREKEEGVKEKGPMGGINGALTIRPQGMGDMPVNMMRLDGHVNYAQVDYSGSGKINNINDAIFESRLVLGHDWAAQGMRLTPYAGVGYRHLFDNMGGKRSSTGGIGYDRRSQYLYAPAGLDYIIPIAPSWKVGVNGEFDYLIRGWQDSYFSDVSGLPNLKNTQKKGYGIRGSFKIMKLMDRCDLIVEPYVRYWHIKDSDVNVAENDLVAIEGYEPENTSLETGLKLAVGF